VENAGLPKVSTIMMIKKIAALAVGLWLSAGAALAQSNPNLTFGQVLTPAQWSNLFAQKQDTLGFTPLNVAGGVMTGRLVTAPPSSTTSGFNLTPGSTPASPVNGDLWIASGGIFAQINGATVGPFIASSSPSSNTIPNLTVTGSFTATGLVTNADLVNQSTTVNGQTCTLGGTCTISASAGTVSVGVTTVALGSSGFILYDNAGVLGNLPVTGTAGNVVLSASPTIASPTLTGTVAGTPALSGPNFVALGNIVQDTVAWSFLGNASGSTTNYTPFTIGGLTNKTTPVGADLAMIQDSVGGGLKFATLTQLLGSVTSGVSSINGLTGAIIGVDTNTPNAQTAAYSLATTDCGKTITLGGSAFYTFTAGAASGFSSTCTFNVVNIDTGRAKKMTVNGITYPNGGFLWPGQAATIKNENNVWTITSNPGRWVLSIASNFFADSTNGSDSGSTDCMAAGTSACATVTHAASLFCQNILKHGQSFTININPAGNQVENIALCSYTPDEQLAQGTAPVISGSSTGAIFPASGTAITAVGVNTPWTISSLIVDTANAACIEADINSLIYVGNVQFDTCNSVFQALFGGKIELLGTIVLTANVAAVVSTGDGGVFISAGQTFNCSGIGSVTTFAQATDNSVQNWTGTAFSGCGALTGQRYASVLGGGIQTSGGGVNFFPGNSVGTATSPGWYN
jgi:hypothetical protein